MPLLGRDKDITTGFIRPERPLLKALFGGFTDSLKARIQSLESENKLLRERIRLLEKEIEGLRLQLRYVRVQMPVATTPNIQMTRQVATSSAR